MTEFVRVKDPDTKHEATVPRKYAEAYGLEILADKEAVNSVGQPLVGKPHIELPKADANAGPGDDTDTEPGDQPAYGSGWQDGGEQK